MRGVPHAAWHRADLPTEKILARKADGIGWLTFNQPERRNAISLAMWDAVAMAPKTSRPIAACAWWS